MAAAIRGRLPVSASRGERGLGGAGGGAVARVRQALGRCACARRVCVCARAACVCARACDACAPCVRRARV